MIRDGIDFSQRHRVVIPLTFRKTSNPNMEYKPVTIAALLIIIFLITFMGYQFIGENVNLVSAPPFPFQRSLISGGNLR